MQTIWLVVLGAFVGLVAAAVAATVVSRRVARARMEALAAFLTREAHLARPVVARNQAGPGLEGTRPNPRGGPARGFRVYYGEAGGGIFNRWTTVQVDARLPETDRVRVLPRRQAVARLREGEVALDDARLDGAFRVLGQHAGWVRTAVPREILGSLLRVERLWHLALHRNEVEVVAGGWEDDPDKLRYLLDLASRAAQAAEAAGPPEPQKEGADRQGRQG